MKQHMNRRFALPLFAAVGLAALTGSRVGMAAEQTPSPPGTITTVAGTGAAGFSGDGGPATAAQLTLPFAIVVDAAGSILFTDAGNHRIRKVNAAGMISTVAGTGQPGFSGDGGPATEAQLNFPQGLVLDGTGNLIISDTFNNRVRKVTPQGLITTIAGNGKDGISGDGGPATEAQFSPGGVVVDATGNLFIADPVNHRIRKVSPEGIISTLAGSGPVGPTNGTSAGDGGLATEARLNGPFTLALDRAGNLFFAEIGYVFSESNRGYRVRKVDLKGIITTVAGSDAQGFSGDGGPATAARLDTPHGVVVDTAGNLFIADRNNYRVRKVDANGNISTVAGIGAHAYLGDGSPAVVSGLRGPMGLAVDLVGNLLIGDTQVLHEVDGLGDNARVLKVYGTAAPGLIAGQPFPSP